MKLVRKPQGTFDNYKIMKSSITVPCYHVLMTIDWGLDKTKQYNMMMIECYTMLLTYTDLT